MFFPKFLKIAFAVIFAGTLSVVTFAQAKPVSPTEPAHAAVQLRIAYWQAPKGAPEVLYYRDGSKFVPFQIFQKAFLRTIEYSGAVPIAIFRKATAEEIEQRKHMPGMSKTEREYVPVFQIKTGALRDVGVLILPVEKLEDISENKVLIFDYSEAAFPYGSACIINLSRFNLLGQFSPKNQEPQNFRLGAGKRFVSAPINERAVACELSLAAKVKGKEKPIVVYSAPALFFANKRSLIFAMATKTDELGVPEFSICQITERRPVATKPSAEKTSRGEKSSNNGRPGEKNRTRRLPNK